MFWIDVQHDLILGLGLISSLDLIFQPLTQSILQSLMR
jgi:hypothetical protein